ncbi:MAG: hypothetical protein AB4372_05880 [Xenococcus sp. (in: cyanobacteria)]
MISHKGRVVSLMMEDADKIAFMHNWSKAIEEIPKIFAEEAFIIAFYYCLRIATRLACEKKQEIAISKIDPPYHESLPQ